MKNKLFECGHHDCKNVLKNVIKFKNNLEFFQQKQGSEKLKSEENEEHAAKKERQQSGAVMCHAENNNKKKHLENDPCITLKYGINCQYASVYIGYILLSYVFNRFASISGGIRA